MDFVEGVGESSSPPRTFSGFANYDVRNDVFNRLVEIGHEQAVSNPDFREQLEAHFNRLPPSYGLDVNMDRAEDVLLHQSLLTLARDPEKRPVFHVRYLENISTQIDDEDQQIVSTHSSPKPSSHATNGGAVSSHKRTRDHATDFEPCSKLEDLNLDVRKNSKETEEKFLTHNFSPRNMPDWVLENRKKRKWSVLIEAQTERDQRNMHEMERGLRVDANQNREIKAGETVMQKL